jgi:hypothetical protein
MLKAVSRLLSSIFFAGLLLVSTGNLRAEEKPAEEAKTAETPSEDGNVDFESEETFIDVADAVKSKQYIHRAILSTIIRDTAKHKSAGFYLNHLMGFSNVWQRAGDYNKYFSGVQGVSLGYVTSTGHGFEAGAEFSSVSNLFFGYRYFLRVKNYTVWPFVGAGTGIEMQGLSLSDGPPESRRYSGVRQMGFLTLGLLIPIVDVAAKAELRFAFYGVDRIVFSQGIGIILFL